MRNQCSDLFTYIMDYLYVLCMTHDIDLCTIYNSHDIFYVYYELFTYINLENVMWFSNTQ
jgi:hypothetical protein